MLRYNKIIMIAVLPAIVFAEWQSLGGPPAGRADDMSIGEYLGTYYLYAADKTHCLYRSTNLGAEWDSIYAANTDKPTCVVAAENDGWIVYIGRQDDNPEQRVMKSTDGGQNWDPAGGTEPNWITNPKPLCFAMDPNDASIVYLGCAVGACGVFKTDDGGETWDEKPLPTSPVNPSVNDIAIVGTSIFLACSGKDTDDGIWQSTNGGIDWNQQMSNDDIYSVEFANQSVGYAGSDGIPYGIYKTTNGGTNWIPLPNSPSYYSTYDLIAINTNTIYAATDAGIYKTTDGGGTWVPKNNGILIIGLSSIIVHPNDVQTLFTGGISVYKTVDGGDQWSDKSQGYKCYKMLSVSSVTPYLYTIGHRTRNEDFMIVSISTDCGTNWYATRISPASSPEEPFYVEVDYSEPERALAGCYRLSGTIDQNEGGQIYRTLNAGYNWNFSYSPSTGNSSAYLYGIRTNTSNSDWVYAGYNYAFNQYGFMRNGRFGQYGYWEAAVSGLGTNSVRCIAVDQEVWNMIYVGTSANGVYKSTNNGNNWVQTELDDKRVNALAIDIDYPDTIYAGSENNNGIYKTTNGFTTYPSQVNNGLDYLYISDLEIDPSEPTIVYTLCKENEGAEETHVYCTVDRAGKWFDVGDGLPNEYVSDLEIDLDGTEPVHAATEQGVYTYTPDFNKSLVSSSDEATFANNGRKMLRNGNDIWITYESGGVVYVVHSDDNGQSWSKKREMGKGYNPCMGMKLIQIPSGPTLGLVWWAQGIRDTLYFSKYSSGSWGSPMPIVTSNNDFSPPSFVLGYSDYGHMVYVEGGSYIKYTKFDINGVSAPQTYEVDTGDNENPSIGYMLSLGNPEIHIVYKSGGRLYYKSRTGSTWNDREFIFFGATHPCLEVVGTVVHIVCRVANNIRHYYTVYTGGPRDWNEEQVNNSDDYSDYPVITSGSACSWVEDGGTNKEIVYSWHSPLGWSSADNISDTDECSDYPHFVHKQTIEGTVLYFTWTEKDAVPYHIEFTSRILGIRESGEDPDLMFYLADAGEKVASPFNRRRESYAQYGPEFFKKIDYDSEYLEYQFEGLSSENEYALTVYAYQQDFSNLNITVKADNAELAKITIPEDTLIMCKKMLPIKVYADSMVNVKIFGEKALCAALVLHEYEEESKGGGPQSSETMPTQFGQLTLSTYPNPTKKAVRIEYNLPAKMGVKLSIYDVTGRLVKNIVNENQDAGFYHESFDMTDLSQGVYFVKLNTGDKSITEKVIFLR